MRQCSVILGKQFQPVVRYIIFDGDDAIKNNPDLKNRHGCPIVTKCVPVCKDIKSASIILNCFSMDTQVSSLVECVLLKESQADDSGDFQNQLLIVRRYVASDQLDDFRRLLSDSEVPSGGFDSPRISALHCLDTRATGHLDTHCSW